MTTEIAARYTARTNSHGEYRYPKPEPRIYLPRRKRVEVVDPAPADQVAHYHEIARRLGRGHVAKLVAADRVAPLALEKLPEPAPVSESIWVKASKIARPERRQPHPSDAEIYAKPIIIPSKWIVEYRQTLAQMPTKVRACDVIKAASDYYGLPAYEIIGKCRTKTVALSRQIAIYVFHKASGRSLPETSRSFGGRDHSTILHSVRKVTRLLGEGKITIPEPLLRFLPGGETPP